MVAFVHLSSSVSLNTVTTCGSYVGAAKLHEASHTSLTVPQQNTLFIILGVACHERVLVLVPVPVQV